MEEKKNVEEVAWNEKVQAVIRLIGAIVGIIALISAFSCSEASQKDQIWKGQPYETALNEIVKNYDLVYQDDGMFLVCDKNTHTELRSNKQDIDAIKKLIMKKLSFEPESSYESTYNNDFLTWETAKYQIEIMSGRGNFVDVGKDAVYLDGRITIVIELL